MHVDSLIIGQGICGTFLSWYFERAGLSCVVIDEPKPSALIGESGSHPALDNPARRTASRSAAGVINPVTGRRIVTTWMIDELLPFAENAYRELGEMLNRSFMERTALVDFFPSVQMRQAFLERYAQDPAYLRLPADEQTWSDSFQYELGYGLIEPCFLVDLPALLTAARIRMQQRGMLREEHFESAEVIMSEPSFPNTTGITPDRHPDSLNAQKNKTASIQYRDITADRIIFCDGMGGSGDRWFGRLPFAPNKGEALILEIPGLLPGIYKKGMTLAPWSAGPDQFWVGSSYEWSFTDDKPTAAFRERTETLLHNWLKLPFTILDHFAAVRPATLERRPFIGFHPAHPAIGIFNGMGTKGCSLAPFFAAQLTDHIRHGAAIRPDADVKRFTKILSR